MYNAQFTIERIQSTIKNNGFTQKKVLSDCGISENTLKRMTDKKGMSSFYLAKIADYLDCSVDYLLGRDEKYIGGHNVSTGDIKDNHDVNINSTTQPCSVGELEREICEILSKLDTRRKTELMNLIYKYIDEYENSKEAVEV